MPSITLTLPVDGEIVTAELHADNYTAIQSLLNGGLDTVNLPSIAPYAVRDATECSWSSATYDDPDLSGTVGPTLSGLPPGKYVVDYGAAVQAEGAQTIFLTLAINGVPPGDDDDSMESLVDLICPGATSFLVTLDEETNSLKMVYRCGGSTGHTARRRWIKAVKYDEVE